MINNFVGVSAMGWKPQCDNVREESEMI